MEPKKLTREQLINLAKQCNAQLEIINGHMAVTLAKLKLGELLHEAKELENGST